MNDAREVLTEDVFKLITSSEPGSVYYGSLILRMHRIFKQGFGSLAGVSCDRHGNFLLYIDPELWLATDQKSRINILKHECMHVLHGHLHRAKAYQTEQKKEKVDTEEKLKEVIKEAIKSQKNNMELNISMDCSINQYIGDITAAFGKDEKGEYQFSKGITLESFNDKYKVNAVSKREFEYYYDLIKKSNENNQDEQEGNGEGSIDSHSLWLDVDIDESLLREYTKKIVNDTAKANGGIGNLPSEIQSLIMELNKTTKNWRNELRRFATRASYTESVETRKRHNRRYGILQPGKKQNNKLALAVVIDESGSVSEEELSQFYAEIGKISETGANVKIITCDNQVNKVYDYDRRKLPTRNGQGGTCMQPALDWINANMREVDGCIMFTDGGIYDELKKPKYPILFAITGECEKPVQWGYETRVTINK